MRRLSIKTRVTLVVTAFLLVSLALVSVLQLYYVKADMKRVLADQQLSLGRRVADDIDEKLALNRDALVAAARILSQHWVDDPAKMESMLAQRVVLATCSATCSSTPPKAAS